MKEKLERVLKLVEEFSTMDKIEFILNSFRGTEIGNRCEIKASVIQKEAASVSDMPFVSSVIDNRIKKGMRLQMDGTLNYGEYSHQKVTARRIRTDKTPYNTYKNKGLPVYPVCNVSKDAIHAAINPKDTDYLYFVRGKNGEHVYSCYFSTHHQNIVNATK